MRKFHISNTLLLRQATLVTFWLSLEIVMNIHIQLITEMPRDDIFLFISRNCQSSKESLSLVVLSYQQ